MPGFAVFAVVLRKIMYNRALPGLCFPRTLTSTDVVGRTQHTLTSAGTAT